jgi:hypothetical protein
MRHRIPPDEGCLNRSLFAITPLPLHPSILCATFVSSHEMTLNSADLLMLRRTIGCGMRQKSRPRFITSNARALRRTDLLAVAARPAISFVLNSGCNQKSRAAKPDDIQLTGAAKINNRLSP